jgi:hypothetical protein
MKTLSPLWLGASLVLLGSPAALAHHSFAAEFDDAARGGSCGGK